MKLKLDTVIFYVRDIERLKIFYTSVLGLTVLEDEPEGWVLLQAGQSCIGLHKVGEAYRQIISAEGPGSNVKIVFELDGDIINIREELMHKGVEMREVKTFDNYAYWLCDGQDPEGNIFQLKQRKIK